jgi:hypothetical protein
METGDECGVRLRAMLEDDDELSDILSAYEEARCHGLSEAIGMGEVFEIEETDFAALFNNFIHLLSNCS